MFLEAIAYSLANLTKFTGRDSRSTFWWYILFLLIVQFVIGLLASIPLVVGTTNAAIDAAQSGMSEAQMEAQLFNKMADMVGVTTWISVITSAIITLLALASFVRRLHDGGFSELWAAIPLMTQAATIYFSITMIDKAKDMLLTAGNAENTEALAAQMSANPMSYIGWIGYLAVITFGMMRSEPTTNQYGEVPKAPGY